VLTLVNESSVTGGDLNAGELSLADELADGLGADANNLTHLFSFPNRSGVVHSDVANDFRTFDQPLRCVPK
jgi:hypothetical protein